jgi:formylglycine-generating enzyme required for sulfatase activity
MKLKHVGVLLLLSHSMAGAEDFQSQLAKIGIPQNEIEILLKENITQPEQFKGLTKEDLQRIKISLGSAQKLLVNFGEKPVMDAGKMSEIELLTHLAGNPQDDNALQTLKSKPLIQKAEGKTSRWAVVNPDDKKLDVPTTLKYLTFLSKPNAAKQTEFEKKRTTSIEIALGKSNSGEMAHPLFDGEIITDGLDSQGIDWSDVPPEVMKALLWARKTTHPAFPKEAIDAWDLHDKAATKPLTNARLKRMVSDYQAKVEEEDPTATSISLKPTPATFGDEGTKKKLSEVVPAETAPPKVIVTDNSPPKKVFQDKLKDGQPCSFCPKMVDIPEGKSKMGDLSGKGKVDELPVRNVSVEKPFAIGIYEVTFAEYDEFVADTNQDRADDNGWGRGNRPVINVSWKEANAYVDWLSTQTGKTYRLPTEAEWEYAARAGTETDYWWGDEMGSNNANCKVCGSQGGGQQTALVGSFKPNPFGLYDTAGNIAEWMCSEYENTYKGKQKICNNNDYYDYPRVTRGGGWADEAQWLRVSSRYQSKNGGRDKQIGFRVVRMPH